MKVRLNTIGLNLAQGVFREGVEYEVGSADGQIPEAIAQARLAAKTAVIVYANGVGPGFVERLNEYLAQLGLVADNLVRVLDLAEVGSDAEAIALVDAMRDHQAATAERLGARVQALFERVAKASLAELDALQPNVGEGDEAGQLADVGGDGSASSIGASQEAAASLAASTSSQDTEHVMGVETVPAEASASTEAATDVQPEPAAPSTPPPAPARKGGRQKAEG